ncbi:MAG TPA: glycosyltransferase family 39 protein [Blastocatellia bacterium]|nr:glycosyltransferase family 39 protein [Blastocatellia bacterium]
MSRTITKANAEEARDHADADRPEAAPASTRRNAGWVIAPLIVLLVTAAVYGSIYFREESLATGIGANLVPAERVLKGEVPYRDFYKIQTPGILLLNAGLFKLFGTSLLTAFRGVLVFKVLAVVMVFVVARLVVSQTVALVPALLSTVWLPPGGPFRPAPIQYEMLFILAAIYFALRWIDSRRALQAFAAALAVGVVAVFKQNVGVYLAIALALALVVNSRELPRSLAEAKELYLDSWRKSFSSHIAAVTGVALPLLALLAYLVSNNALGAAMRVFVRGPGEHIQMKLTGYPLPKYALLVLIVGVAAVKIAAAMGNRLPRWRRVILVVTLLGAAGCSALAPQSVIDNSIYWFAPALFVWAAWIYLSASRRAQTTDPGAKARGALLVLLAFSIASYLEVFPRSVRGLVIGTLPPAFVLLAFIFAKYRFEPDSRQVKPKVGLRFEVAPAAGFQFAIVGIIALIFAGRLIAPSYFTLETGRPSFKADTELSFESGRGVYLPARRAAEVNATVDLVRARVEEGGFFFAHALDATPYYFLTNRNSPTGATLWNDAGTNEAERARTMEMLQQKQVKLVLTSDPALAGERYEPLLAYLNEFRRTAQIGKIVVLEKSNE